MCVCVCVCDTRACIPSTYSASLRLELNQALVKLKTLSRDLVSLHIVTVGNGICQTGVVVSPNDIKMGESCHWRHTLLIKYALPTMQIIKTISHHNLNITGKDKKDELEEFT